MNSVLKKILFLMSIFFLSFLCFPEEQITQEQIAQTFSKMAGNYVLLLSPIQTTLHSRLRYSDYVYFGIHTYGAEIIFNHFIETSDDRLLS